MRTDAALISSSSPVLTMEKESALPCWYVEDSFIDSPLSQSIDHPRNAKLRFRLVQVLTDHGYVGGYLRKVTKRNQPPPATSVALCLTHHGGKPFIDTLPGGVGGRGQRKPLVYTRDQWMIGSKRCQIVVASFYKQVIIKKEAMELNRKSAHPLICSAGGG